MSSIKNLFVSLVATSALALGSSHANAGVAHYPTRTVTFPGFWQRGPFAPRVVLPRCAPAPVHVHAYTIVCERVWCPPVTQVVTIGYDACGTPIQREIVTQSGYWKIARYRVCECGDRIFLGWD